MDLIDSQEALRDSLGAAGSVVVDHSVTSCLQIEKSNFITHIESTSARQFIDCYGNLLTRVYRICSIMAVF